MGHVLAQSTDGSAAAALGAQPERGHTAATPSVLLGTVADVMVRCTARLQTIVGKPSPGALGVEPNDNDWYANLLWISGRKCLLATHAGTLFSVFAPDVRAAELRPLGDFLVPRIVEQLAAEGFPTDALGPLDPTEVVVGKTASRQVLGCMNDIAFACQHIAALEGGLPRLDLIGLHRHLQRNIVSARNYIPPITLVADRIANG